MPLFPKCCIVHSRRYDWSRSRLKTEGAKRGRLRPTARDHRTAGARSRQFWYRLCNDSKHEYHICKIGRQRDLEELVTSFSRTCRLATHIRPKPHARHSRGPPKSGVVWGSPSRLVRGNWHDWIIGKTRDATSKCNAAQRYRLMYHPLSSSHACRGTAGASLYASAIPVPASLPSTPPSLPFGINS